MIGTLFIVGGQGTVRDPQRVAKAAERVGVPIAEKVPGLPTEPETLVRINGGVQVAAGVLLAIGKAPRLASLALLGSIVPTTAAGHRFWEEDDEGMRTQQLIHFLKNLAVAGGLVLSAFDLDGAPSIGWRARRRAERAAAKAATARAKAAARTAKATRGAAAQAAKGTALLEAGRAGVGTVGSLVSHAADALPVG